MKSELFKIADMLLKFMSKSNKDVISTYKHNIEANNLDTARIISDELVDYFAEMDNSKAEEIANNLYSKTMEYYEINSN